MYIADAGKCGGAASNRGRFDHNHRGEWHVDAKHWAMAVRRSAAQLDPFSVAVDAAGNVYVTDSFNDRVRMLTPQTVKPASMSIVSGNGQSATVGTSLAAPLVLKVTDSTGAGVAGSGGHFHRQPGGRCNCRAVAGHYAERWHGYR